MSATASATLQNFVDGERVDPASDATSVVLNPATGEELAQAPDSGAEDVDRAVAAARGAFEGWAAATPGESALALLRAGGAGGRWRGGGGRRRWGPPATSSPRSRRPTPANRSRPSRTTSCRSWSTTC